MLRSKSKRFTLYLRVVPLLVEVLKLLLGVGELWNLLIHVFSQLFILLLAFANSGQIARDLL